jgi:L,D-peptidoglycan transpeptidase YkuD (ErfK/YbiS/YcfS/YnhG family)
MYVGNASISSKGVTRQKSATVRYPDSPNSRQATKTKGKGKPTDTKETTAGVAVDSEGTATNIGKDGKMPAKRSGNVKKITTGGGLTEVRNSNIETGNRGKK